MCSSDLVYFNFIDTMGNAQGRTGNNVFQSQDEAKRKEFQARQKKALAALKKQPAKAQPAEAEVEDRRQPGDQTHD